LFATTRQFLDDLGLASLDQLPVFDSAQAQANAFARLGEDDPSLQLDMALESTETAQSTPSAPIFELSSPRDPAPTGNATNEH
jgi:segregation and condensation protein B